MKFADNLRQLRREKDISQESLAVEMKVSRQTISKWENGTAMPDIKKLTELADYFNTSMDKLLGLSEDIQSEANQVQNDYNKNYINSMLTFLEDNEKKRYNKLFKRFAIILIVLIIAFAVTVSSIVKSFNEQVLDLCGRIDNYQQEVNLALMAGNESDEEDETTSYEILGIDKKNPNIAKVRFRFEPDSYEKDSHIYFVIPQYNGKSKSIEAENNNGVFTLEADVDILAKGDYFVCIDDGSKVSKKKISINPFDDLFNTSIISSISCRMVPAIDGKSASINIGSDDDLLINNVDFYLNDKIKLKEARIIVEADNDVVYSKIPYINKSDEVYCTGWIELSKFSVKLENGLPKSTCFYISFITEEGLEFRYYPDLYTIIENVITLGDEIFEKSGIYEIIYNDKSVAYDYTAEVYL